ncbi:hypothetical protein QE412_002695 [Microbacterium trichothecenolyticum]|uniref:Uncharacterized protein n=1 Tax=Microbacterium trichothecenolyticum TaxID=69370 RepID=A0ABU0TWS8_MICTR|nr:hypothetical protein [Microbacterium trichothecenolyticum]
MAWGTHGRCRSDRVPRPPAHPPRHPGSRTGRPEPAPRGERAGRRPAERPGRRPVGAGRAAREPLRSRRCAAHRRGGARTRARAAPARRPRLHVAERFRGPVPHPAARRDLARLGPLLWRRRAGGDVHRPAFRGRAPASRGRPRHRDARVRRVLRGADPIPGVRGARVRGLPPRAATPTARRDRDTRRAGSGPRTHPRTAHARCRGARAAHHRERRRHTIRPGRDHRLALWSLVALAHARSHAAPHRDRAVAPPGRAAVAHRGDDRRRLHSRRTGGPSPRRVCG